MAIIHNLYIIQNLQILSIYQAGLAKSKEPVWLMIYPKDNLLFQNIILYLHRKLDKP